jgi:glutathione synthase/RimK-type ligase-like ATP-grasp enzyme
MKRVGILVGRERAFPDALIAAVAAKNAGVVADYPRFEAVRADRPLGYDVLIDRISHDVPAYQPILKLAALDGALVINNPFWRIADDKFLDAALASRLGVAVPRTAVLPANKHIEDVTTESLRNLAYPIDWDALGAELRWPLYLKPHWGGGWRDVHRVEDRAQLLAAYDQSGRKTMIVQEGIEWTQYVRCIVIGKDHVRPALWDPRRPHHERYVRAAESMAPLSDALTERVVKDARTLCRALGYDMNTVEFAIRDGVPYAVDFMNSAPDLDVASLGEAHFRWAVDKMADLVIAGALDPARGRMHPQWDALLRGA